MHQERLGITELDLILKQFKRKLKKYEHKIWTFSKRIPIFGSNDDRSIPKEKTELTSTTLVFPALVGPMTTIFGKSKAIGSIPVRAINFEQRLIFSMILALYSFVKSSMVAVKDNLIKSKSYFFSLKWTTSNWTIYKNIFVHEGEGFRAGVSNTCPAGRMWPARCICAARK